MSLTRITMKTSYWAGFLAILSHTALFLGKGIPWLIIPAAALIYGFLPGFILVKLLLKRDYESYWLEHPVLGAASSFAISSLAVLGVHFLPGPLTLTGVILAIDVFLLPLLVVLWLREMNSQSIRNNFRRQVTTWRDITSHLLPIITLLALIVIFRFVSLDYSEYQGDEIDVTGLARLAIAGQDDAFFWHKKGPAELVITTASALFNRNFEEFAMRVPFALASGWAILGVYALGYRVWGRTTGFLTAVLVSINGIFLGFSRMVQYQGVVALLLVSAVLCYYRLNQTGDSAIRLRLAILGLCLWGFSLRSHYEASRIGLVLAFLYFTRRRDIPQPRQTVRLLFITGIIVIVVLLAYYIPFINHEHFLDTLHSYANIRISPDRMPFNNLGDYLTSGLFYNSVYYEILMSLGLLGAAWFALQRALGPEEDEPATHKAFSWPGLVLWTAFSASLLIGSVTPGGLQVGGLHLPLFLAAPALLVLIFNHRNSIGLRMVFLWFGIYLIAYGFLIRVPGLHYYTLLPAWALLAVWGLEKAIRHIISFAPAWRWAFVFLAIVLGGLLLYHPYLLFVRTTPEYALSYPEFRNSVYWNTLEERPQRFFGLPHRSGWKGAAYLLATDALAEGYRSNEKEEIIAWYMGDGPSQAETPAYYLIADNATAKEHEQDYSQDLLDSAYREIGGITVSGELRLHIYQKLPAQEGIGLFEDEALTPLYYQMAGLNLPKERRP